MYAATIEPRQVARLLSIDGPLWADAIASSIGSDPYFRWHDSGDLQGVAHLEKIAQVCELTPNCRHWLPTREYGIVKDYIARRGALPRNLIVRLSAMYPDRPVAVPASLRGVANIVTANVHTLAPMGFACGANKRGGKCGDCRACWDASINAVSYNLH